MEEKLDKFLAYLEENGVEISGETAFKCDDGIVLFTLKDGKEQKMQGFNGVQEFYYNDLEELEYLRKQVYEAGMV